MMLCTRDVQKVCQYSYMCSGDDEIQVADNSECADFIMSVKLKEVALNE